MRPVIRTNPSSSISPTSPVWNQPSRSSTSAVAASSSQYPAKTWPPRNSSSPSSATRTDVPGSGRPTVPIFTAPGVFAVSAAGGLGQPVALEDGQPDAAVEVAQPLAERRAAGDGVRAPAAESGAQPSVDQPGERRVLGAHGDRRPAAGRVEAARPGDRHLGGALEDPAATLGGGVLGGGVEDLLEHPGHGEHERRPELAQVAHQVADVGAVTEPDPRLHRPDLDDAREDVSERQEEQRRRVVAGEQLLELGHRDPQLRQEVAVREHAALGAAGRARGVDDRGQVEGRRRRTPGLEVRVGDVGAEAGQHPHGVVVDRPDVPQLLEVGAHLGDPGQVGRPLGDHGAGPGVAQDVSHLLGRRRLVHGHRHRAREPDRVVEERPLVPGPGDEGHPVAGLDAGGDQSLRDVAYLGQELRGGDVLPLLRAGRPAREHHGVGRLRRVADDVVGEVARRGHGDRQGSGELTQGATSDSGADPRARLPPDRPRAVG